MSVIKSDGREVPFDAQSLFDSTNEATASWHTHDQIRQVIRAVTDSLFGTSAVEPVASSRIGELVSQQLKRLNSVSHIRFALVFVGRTDRTASGDRGMADARAFRRWLGQEYAHLAREVPPARLSWVIKVRTGGRERFDRGKLKRTALIACKGRGVPDSVERLASDAANDVIEALGEQPIVTTGQITTELLRSLRARDDIAYLRYASTVKQFSSVLDYEAEALALETQRRSAASRANQV
jgi:transcriptional regulator NrdR family protein